MKFLSFTRNQGIIVLTLLFVVLLGGLYFFLYIPANRKNLERQRFRGLQNVETNIDQKIENSISLLKSLLINYRKERLAKGTTASNQAFAANKSAKKSFNEIGFTREYIKSYPSDQFKLIPITKDVKGAGDTTDLTDTVSWLEIQKDQEIVIYLKIGADKIGVKYAINQFMDPLLPKDIFDDYLLLQSGEIIYQTFASGINVIPSDTLNVAHTAFKEGQVRNIDLGGAGYKLFWQQMRFHGTNLVIAGLLSKKVYQNEQTELPGQVILFLLSASMGIILALPWIKLYQMGSQDRLTILDGLFCTAVSMLLMSLLFYGVFKYNRAYNTYESETPPNLVTLAANIDAAVSKELKDRKSLLSVLNKLRKDSINRRFVKFENKCSTSGKTSAENKKLLFSDRLSRLTCNEPVKQIFWMNEKGDELSNWDTRSQVSPPGRFANRAYVRELKNKPYYLDQVVSRTDGQFSTILSMPVDIDSLQISAMSFTLKSLDKPVLPTGYLFAIINLQGNVLYHSNSAKNLNENLLSELSEIDELNAAILNGDSTNFNTKYFGKRYHAFAKKMTGLPYYLVLLEDTVYEDSVVKNSYAFFIFMLAVFFLLVVLQYVFQYSASHAHSFFNKQYFDVSWLGPVKKFRDQYGIALCFNVVLILLLIFMSYWSTFVEYFFILLAAVNAVSMALNYAFCKYYLINSPTKYRLKLKANIVLLLILFLENCVAFKLLDFISSTYLVFEVFLLVAGFLLVSYYDLFLRWVTKLGDRLEVLYSNAFTTMIFSRLIITSGIPAAFFFISASNYDSLMLAKFKHLNYEHRLAELKAPVDQTLLNQNNYFKDGKWVDEVKLIAKKDAPAKTSNRSENRLRRILSISKQDLYPLIGDSTAIYSSDQQDGAIVSYIDQKDGQYLEIRSARLNGRPDKAFVDFYKTLIWILFIILLWAYYKLLKNTYVKLFALHVPSNAYWDVIDDVIYSTESINNLLFVIGSPGACKLETIKDLLFNNEGFKRNRLKMYEKEDADTRNTVLVADMILIPEKIKEANQPIEEYDTDKEWRNLISLIANNEFALIIVQHFEYDIKNPATNSIKLNLLESLLQKKQGKIIILSTVHPITFLDSLNHMARYARKATTATGQDGLQAVEARLPDHDLERWHVLLGHFKIIIQPIKRFYLPAPKQGHFVPETKQGKIELEDKDSEILSDSKTDNTGFSLKKNRLSLTDQLLNFLMTCFLPAKDPLHWQNIFVKETEHTRFLNQMQSPVRARLLKLDQKQLAEPIRGNDLAYKMQVTSHYYYMYIWQSLTKEEKYLLYDLAEDGLVNSFDDYNLTLLIRKGLINRDDGLLRLFNKGFRNFILTAIGNTEAIKIKNQIATNGNWAHLKTPLAIFIIAVLVFLFTSQQEAYSTLIKYITVLSFSVPALFKLLTIFNKEKPEKE
jgi:hypothetical protein